MSGINDDPLNDPLNDPIDPQGVIDDDLVEDDDEDENSIEFPESESQSIWYEKVYESDGNSETANYLIM